MTAESGAVFVLNMGVLSLLIDTAESALVVAVARDTDVVAEVRDTERRAQHVLAVVDEVLHEGGVQRTDLDQVIVGVGPGGFTGLRIGIVTARGIAAAQSLPIIGVSSLAAIALPAAMEHPDTRVCARMDAKRGEWFEAVYACDEDTLPTVAVPLRVVHAEDDLAAVPHDADVVVLGPPTAQGLLYAAAGVSAVAPHQVLPEYGRQPDAKPGAWQVSGGRP